MLAKPPSTGDNQLGQRNLTRDQGETLLERLYNREKAAVRKSEGRNQCDEVIRQNDGQPTTAARLAAQYNVSPRTVERVGQSVEAAGTIGTNVGEGVKQKILTREAPLRSALGAEIERRGEALKRV